MAFPNWRQKVISPLYIFVMSERFRKIKELLQVNWKQLKLHEKKLTSNLLINDLWRNMWIILSNWSETITQLTTVSVSIDNLNLVQPELQNFFGKSASFIECDDYGFVAIDNRNHVHQCTISKWYSQNLFDPCFLIFSQNFVTRFQMCWRFPSIETICIPFPF